MTSIPNYYTILDIPTNATQDDIRQAYKKQALLHHPDRLDDQASQTERSKAVKYFQLIADAYYILGDQARRAEYDKAHPNTQTFSLDGDTSTSERQAHLMFSNVFEELLRPEVENPSHVWSVLGAGAGIVLGFIVGNVGGAAMATVAGRTLGQIRDKKGRLLRLVGPTVVYSFNIILLLYLFIIIIKRCLGVYCF
ncbi:DnaJ domain-containing protein [Phycomyces nitens]|nr:DnaJ domain-containing protein [Phycomyces nitens]